MLLVAAGLFVRAVDRGARIDPGFDRDGITTTLFDPESWGYDTGASTAFYAAVRERLATAPGVSAVAYTSRLPLMLGSSIDTIAFGTSKREAHYAGVDEGYFDVLRSPILRGRAIARTDGAGAVRVAIVNQTLARILAPDGDALGRTFRFRDAERIVVGVARDARYASLDETTPPFFYVPLAQSPTPSAPSSSAGGGDDGAGDRRGGARRRSQAAGAAGRRVRRGSAGGAVPQRAAAIVTGGLGVTGLLLATLGLYGTVAGSAAARTREIGIRLALGAGRGEVLRTVVGEGARLAAAGIVVGLPLAALSMPLLQRWLFEIDPLDPATYVALSLVLGAVALAASYLPARRAAATDPVRALRTLVGIRLSAWASRRPPGKARGARIPGVCKRRATQPGGMHRRPRWQPYSDQGPKDRLRFAGAAARANAGDPAGAWRRRRADSAFQACDSNSSATPGWPAWRITAAWPGWRSSPHAAIIRPLPARTASSSRPSPRT